MKELTKEDLASIKKVKWGHRIPIGTVNGEVFYTPGFLKHGPDGSDYATERYGMPEDLSEKTVLDIGAYDGYFSFEAEKRGASLVVASDIAESTPENPLEKSHLGGNHGFNLAHSILGSKVKFIERNVYDIDTLPILGKPFDVVLFYGVLYHITEPFLALRKVKLVTKELALIETAISKGDGLTMELRNGFDGDPTNWWYPTINCVRSMLMHVGFRRTEVVFNLEDVRATIAAYV
jgi:tRNA (mo5U34)-methyltransferase